MSRGSNFPIGIFDSGVGGLTVLAELLSLLPEERYFYYADSAFAPYGSRSREEILERSFTITEDMLSRGAKAIVVACNTATSSAITEMRRRFDLPIVGMEPALKPAVEADIPGKILVLGTAFTIRERKYRQLLNRFCKKKEIVSLACPGLVELIEQGRLNSREMGDRLTDIFQDISPDEFCSVVLGCTHFVYLKQEIRRIFGPGIRLFDGNRGTALQTRRLLAQKRLLATDPALNDPEKQIVIDTSGDSKHVLSLCDQLLKQLLRDRKKPAPLKRDL